MDFDIKMLAVLYLMLNVIGAGAMLIIWRQNRLRFAGIELWFVAMFLQVGSSIFIALRGVVPDYVSIVVSNTLLISGVLALLLGLELFAGQKGPRIHDYIMLIIFVAIMIYFSLFQPDINIRTIAFSTMLLVLMLQISWLLLFRVPSELAQIARVPAIVTSGYVLISAGRIILVLCYPMGPGDLFNSDTIDAVPLVLYCGLTCCLMISLILMVNRRLLQNVLLQEKKYNLIFHSSPNAIMLTRISDGIIFEVNEGFTNITGYLREEAIGRTTYELDFWVNEEDRVNMIEELSGNQQIRKFELLFRKKSGEVFYGLYMANVLTINDEECILANLSDISEISKIKHDLQVMATHDDLTGLPNRALLYDRFAAAVANAQRNDNAFAVVSLDIDRFKLINDNLGHLLGDKALIAVAERLLGILRKVDTVARIGGDEFILLLEDVEDRDAVRSVVEKIQNDFRNPFLLGDQEMTLTLSIGVALYPDDGQVMEVLLSKSDDALYRVKEKGRNGYQFYNLNDEDSSHMEEVQENDKNRRTPTRESESIERKYLQSRDT